LLHAAILRFFAFEEFMMRKALVTLSILLAASLQIARADSPTSAAPADEYFGPSSQSVLEIRNRLDDYDQRDVREMLDPSTSTSLNHLELAILDWQHRYPRDPWLPRIMSHLMREYWRCGEASSAAGDATLSVLRSAYPDSPWTTAAVTMVYGSNGTLNEVARDKAPYEEEAPVPEQSAYYNPAPPNEGIPSYATPIAVEPAPQPNAGPNVTAFDVSPPSDEATQSDVSSQPDQPQQNDQPQAEQDDQAPQADAAPQQQEIAPEEAPTPPPAR
jgi:hypothetical protein